MPKGCSTQSLNVFQRTAMAELGTVARHVEAHQTGLEPVSPGVQFRAFEAGFNRQSLTGSSARQPRALNYRLAPKPIRIRRSGRAFSN